MDRKISTKQLKSEKLRLYLKIGVISIAIIISIIIIGSRLRSTVRLSDINISKVDRGDVEITISAMGRVVPAFEEVINSPITSKIVDVYKFSGDSVKRGEPILELNLENINIELKKLKDELKMKQLQLQQMKLRNTSEISKMQMNIEIEQVRQEQLKEKLANEIYLDSLGAGTPSSIKKCKIDVRLGDKQLINEKDELENQIALRKSDEQIATLELEILERTLQQKGKLLDQSQILSPRTAVLSFVNSQIGEQVSEGSKIAMLTDISEFKIKGEISNLKAHNLKIGGEVIAVVDNTKLKGVISNLNPVAIDNVIEFTVQLEDAQNKLLRTGINCDLYIVESREVNKLRVASGSYYEGSNVYELFVKDGDLLKRRSVVLGKGNFEYVVVEDGLREGDEVVVSSLGSNENNIEIKLKK